MLTAVARDQRWPDIVAEISARIRNLLLPFQNLLLSGILMYRSTSPQETLKFSGNKIQYSPWDQSLISLSL